MTEILVGKAKKLNVAIGICLILVLTALNEWNYYRGLSPITRIAIAGLFGLVLYWADRIAKRRAETTECAPH